MSIEFTLSTAPLLALAVFLFYRAKKQWLPVIMFMSVFQAASILNVRLGAMELGINPGFFVLLSALVVKAGVGGKRRASSRTANKLICAFVLYAAVSSFVNPVLFQGVLVSNPRFGIDVPLKWESGHLNQLVYLLLSLSLYATAVFKTDLDELAKSLEWFVGGVVLASCLAAYQYIALKTGLLFPSDYLHTSPTYAIFEGYEINGFPRMNSTFTEASAAAFFMTVALGLTVYPLLSVQSARKPILKTLLLLIGLLLTLSTSGYICLIYISTISTVLYCRQWAHRPAFRLGKLLAGTGLLSVCLTVFAVSGARESIAKLSHTVLLDKAQSHSYEERSQYNISSLETAINTYGLGAGWGVCRASSFIPTILGNVGLPGTMLFAGFCFLVFQPLLDGSKKIAIMHGSILFATGAALVNLFVSGPQLDSPIIWLLFAVGSRLAAKKPSLLAAKPLPGQPFDMVTKTA